MADLGWKRLLHGWPWFRGEGRYPVPAHSEFMPPPLLVRKPYGCFDPVLFADDDPWGWPVTEYEEAFLLKPGLDQVARQVIGRLLSFFRGEEDLEIGSGVLDGNAYWSPELAGRAARGGPLVFLLPLALSLTQDDKGRQRWTFFGGSEQGPARAFWQSFFCAPGRELPADQALAFLRRLLQTAYGETDDRLGDLRRAGFRIVPQGDDGPFLEGPLPGWTQPLLWDAGEPVAAVRYVLTFRPFTRLPAALRRAYLGGAVELLPCPGSLLAWGAPPYLRLRDELPAALQLPLLQLAERHEGLHGLRVPQAGWLAEPLPDGSDPPGHHGRVKSRHRRTRRHARRGHFGQDELTDAREDHLAHVLFSTEPKDIGLDNKPKARNAQLWTHDFRLLLDGPRASPDDIRRAGVALEGGGWFGYRFVYPAMRVGRHEVVWHRPLAAYVATPAGPPVVLDDSPLGHLTASPAEGRGAPLDLWPRLLRRDQHVANVELFAHVKDDAPHQTLNNVRKLLDARPLFAGGPLPRPFARQLLTLPRGETLDGWLDSLPEGHRHAGRARWLADELRRGLEEEPPPAAGIKPAARRPPSYTFARTARRSFEVAFWKAVAWLSAGPFANKNNGDPVLDEPTRAARPRRDRDLEALGEELLARHTRAIADAGMTGRALTGEVPFTWRTDFAFPWLGGWVHNQDGTASERNLVVVIPGRDRGRAVIMADHYDTAYMTDRYQKSEGGSGARLATPGADDNGSATAALLLAAPILLDLSRAGRLGCDVWLVHLTGEEFPAEGLGARRLCQALVEGAFRIQLAGGGEQDLSGVRVQGLYVLDMIAHNTRQGRDVFQISPGVGRGALWLAYQAHLAAEAWNRSAPVWNRRPSRRACGRGRRTTGGRLPASARHPLLSGEVRPHDDPRSTLYNSDGQVFSDAGVPVVLVMENYDIDRSGYHDSRDTLDNINLDYGAALAAIAIEAVARAACEPPWPGC